MSPSEPTRILVRATNWIGDAVMSLPALQAVRDRFPQAHIAVLARPWVAELYAREPFANEVISYTSPRGWRDWRGKLKLAGDLEAKSFDLAILFQNAFEAAALARLARIPRIVGYNRDGRGWLLSDAIQVPKPGEIPRHERFYYLEMLRRAGFLDRLPSSEAIRLAGAAKAREIGELRFQERGISRPVVGVSPGAAFGGAKRWLPERFAETANEVARQLSGTIVLFGSSEERTLCGEVASRLQAPAHNLAGQTSLGEYIELAAACRVYLTNDSGSMHVASALGVPTVAVFGATNEHATGPTGPLARVVRTPVDCAPCLLRECPIDHRCMTRVQPSDVLAAVDQLLQIPAGAGRPPR